MKPNMVDVVVKKEFRDRYSGVKYKPGTKLKITDARRREIQRSGDYVEVAPSAAETKNK